MMRTKAILFIIGILIFVGVLVALLLYGLGNRDGSRVGGLTVPSDAAAKAYVLDHKLLVAVEEIKSINVGGPTFKMLIGSDAAGKAKGEWLTGDDNKITEQASVMLQDGVTKEQVLPKLQEKGIDPMQIEAMYVTPYNYTSHQMVWFIRIKGIKGHMLWYDFKTGEPVWEAYSDPTAWSIRNG
jgi:uncharacterized protein YpmB